jgi:hypothetical protein
MSEDFKIFLDDLLDFLNAQESSIVKMKMQIEKLTGESRPKFSWNPDAIRWEKAQGSKGEYEKSEDVNSMDFKNLLKDLADHKGKLTREGCFYWSFKNGATVGRKRRAKQ